MGITQEQLDKAVADSRGVLEQLLFHEVNNLTKAVMGDADDASMGGEDGGEAPPASEGSAETPSSTDAAPGEAPGEDQPADPAAGGDPGAGAPPSMEQLTQEYAQLDPEELKMHLMAAQAAYEQVSGGAGAGAGGPPGGAPPGAGAPPAGGPPGADMMAMKSEMARLGAELKKSQSEIMDLKKSQNRPRVSQNAVTGQNATERLGAGATAPRVKRMPDRATLTKALTDLTKNEKTSRIDREKINDFYNSGQKNIEPLKTIDGLKSLFA